MNRRWKDRTLFRAVEERPICETTKIIGILSCVPL